MTFTYTPTTTRGQVRLLARDTSTAAHLFEDDEIDAFLSLNDNVVQLAAAMALETVAANEVLIQKRIKLLDVQTDGPAEAEALRKLAASLRQSYEDAGGFDVAEMIVDQFGWVDKVVKSSL